MIISRGLKPSLQHADTLYVSESNKFILFIPLLVGLRIRRVSRSNIYMTVHVSKLDSKKKINKLI